MKNRLKENKEKLLNENKTPTDSTSNASRSNDPVTTTSDGDKDSKPFKNKE